LSLYARSDLMSVSIPPTSGGCGKTHARPVTKGIAAKVWKLDCAKCESYLRGDGKPKVIKVIPGDKENNIASRMEHVIDAHPQWANTPEGVPPTPDEQHVNKIRTERGSHELQMLQALIAAKGAGMAIPDNAMWLLEQNFDPRLIHGKVVCNNGHDNTAGAKFCQQCGIGMASRGVIEEAPMQDEIQEDENEGAEVGDIPLQSLHVATLKKMARQQGLSDKGSKADLLERLGA